MKRWLFNIATAASAITAMLLLVLAVTTAKRLPWGLIDFRLGGFGCRVGGGELAIVSRGDEAHLQATIARGPRLSDVERLEIPLLLRVYTLFEDSYSVSVRSQSPAREVRIDSILIAFWGFFYPKDRGWVLAFHLSNWVAVFSLLPAIWSLGRLGRRLKAHPPGHCQTCGYDLRESRNACPECGRPISVGEA